MGFNPTIFDVVNLLLGLVSLVLGVVALAFGWLFYKEGLKLNRDTEKMLTQISGKISKIDDVISHQFDAVFRKILGADSVEGELPLSQIKLEQKSRRIRRNTPRRQS